MCSYPDDRVFDDLSIVYDTNTGYKNRCSFPAEFNGVHDQEGDRRRRRRRVLFRKI